MSKLTFRADDDLVERVEALDASKSEIMREALREYLDAREGRHEATSRPRPRTRRPGPIDDAIAERVDALVEDHLAARERDVTVNITLDGVEGRVSRGEAVPGGDRAPEAASDADADGGSPAASDAADHCSQCGESVSPEHVYCPNCGEKRSRRVFCDCGDEIRTDWSFCPSCGRRTPAADVLEQP